MRHRGQAPHNERNGETLLRPEPVDHAAGKEERDRVRELEREDDVGVVDLGPAELLLEVDLENADDPTVDVVDRRREEEQRADDPAIASDLARADGDTWLARSTDRALVRHRAGPSDSGVTTVNGELAMPEPFRGCLLT